MSLEEDILIERFLKNKLSETEKNKVLKNMNSDILFREKVLFEQQLFEALDEKKWSFTKNIDSPEVKRYEDFFISDEIKKIKESISIANEKFKKKKPYRFKKWYAYSSVAAIALLISVYLFNSNNQTYEEVYDKYIDTIELPSIANRGDENNFKEISKAEKYFKNKEYSKAAALFSKALKNSSGNSSIHIYLVISQMELNQFQKSEKTLNSLIHSNLIDAEKGYWFKSLLYLKLNQIEKAKNTLSIIIENSYFNSHKAKELLEKITNL